MRFVRSARLVSNPSGVLLHDTIYMCDTGIARTRSMKKDFGWVRSWSGGPDKTRVSSSRFFLLQIRPRSIAVDLCMPRLSTGAGYIKKHKYVRKHCCILYSSLS